MRRVNTGGHGQSWIGKMAAKMRHLITFDARSLGINSVSGEAAGNGSRVPDVRSVLSFSYHTNSSTANRLYISIEVGILQP